MFDKGIAMHNNEVAVCNGQPWWNMTRTSLFICCLVFFGFLPAQEPVLAASYPVEGDLAGAVTQYTVKDKDTLYSIARQFDIGIVEMRSANPGIDPWVPP